MSMTTKAYAKVGSCFITRQKCAKKRSLHGVNEHFEHIFNEVRECETTFAYGSTEIKVAFTTSDEKHVNQHFGATRMLAIYAVEPNASRPVETIRFGKEAMDGNEDKLAARIAALDGCIAVYTQAIGPSAVKRLGARGIRPARVAAGEAIAECLDRIQDALKQGQDGWLAGAMAQQANRSDPGRFDRMAEEGWEE